MASDIPPKTAKETKDKSAFPAKPVFASPWNAIRIAISVMLALIPLWCLIGIAVLRFRAGVMDYATANILTLMLAFCGLVTLLANPLLWRRLSRRTRWIYLLSLVLAAAAAASMLRIDRVSGRMVPSLRLRWSPKPDQLLEAPAVSAAVEAVDLQNTSSNDFPQFLGPHRDLRLTRKNLDRDWAAHPPKLLWRQPIGAGWSGFSAVNGFALTLEQRGDDELVTCYEVTSGKMRWAHAVKGRHDTVMGGVGPRATPTIDEGMVYVQGATGILRCLDGATGALKWSDDIPGRYGVSPQQDLDAVGWGRAASPLIVGDLLLIPFGGPAGGPYESLAAYDKSTGEVIWKGGDAQVSYASPSLVELCGVRQVVIVNENSVSGHSIEDGRVLWSHPWPGGSTSNASVSQAVVVAGDRVLLSKDYGIGAELLQLVPGGDGLLDARSEWKNAGLLKTKFTNVVVIDHFAYGLSDGLLECIDVDTGKRQWKDRRRGNFGHGQILAVDDVLLVQAESGEVVMVEINPEKLVVVSRLEALADQTWNNLCLYGKYLLVRNSVEAACYEVPLRE